MYINSIHIKNFRNIQDRAFDFQKGLNVIIGTNNSGKTNLIKAINLINNCSSVTVNDFNKNILKKWQEDYSDKSPEIEIVYTIKHPLNIENYNEDKILRLLPFMEYTTFESENIDYVITAKVKMVYSLDPRCLEDYKFSIQEIRKKIENSEYIKEPNDENSVVKQAFEDYINILKKLENKFKWNFYNGISGQNIDEETDEIDFVDMENQTTKSVKNILDIEYIEADRNLEKMSSISRRLVKKIIDKKEHNVDYCDIDRVITKEIKEKLDTALKEIDNLIENEQDEIGINNGNIKIMQDFDLTSSSLIGEHHCFNVLDTKSEFNLPLNFNGLGYNNLISIFLIIKLPEIALDIFCVEEPEAHLHPAMQYKLFQYLNELQKKDDLDKQIFITTHSSNITAVTGLDNMIMLSYSRKDNNHRVYSSQLQEQFIDADDAVHEKKQNHKKHLMKFLDVTRSDMLFADKVILVEGISEKLMLPAFMEKEGFDRIDEHVSIVEIGGTHFEHFLSVFNCEEMTKKILCLTDNDFKFIKAKATKCESLASYKAYTPSHIIPDSDCIIFKFQKNYGVTLEDSLFIDNFPVCSDGEDVRFKKINTLTTLLKIVLPVTLHSFVENNLLSFDEWYTNKESIDSRSKEKIKKIIEIYKNSTTEYPEDKELYEKLFFARLYLDYAKKCKGKIALEILVNEELIKNLVTPSYIKEGIAWLQQ